MAERNGVPRLLLLALASVSATLFAQGPGGGNPALRQGSQLDVQGKGVEAREIFQKAIDSAANPSAKANAERAMAMSWAFEGNCKKTAEYENQVIDYWKTQEKDDPSHAFYQEGEMADEAARVCIDTGDLNTASELYNQGREFGLKEPNISPGRKDLWEFRWQNAEARIAARREQKAEAAKYVAAAKATLDDMQQKDATLYDQQKAFLPYLEGYVAYYSGDYKSALAELQQANQRDPFIQCLLGMTYEKLGDKDKAMDAYRQASQTTAHNPPAAFARPFATKKLGNTSTGSQQ